MNMKVVVGLTLVASIITIASAPLQWWNWASSFYSDGVATTTPAEYRTLTVQHATDCYSYLRAVVG